MELINNSEIFCIIMIIKIVIDDNQGWRTYLYIIFHEKILFINAQNEIRYKIVDDLSTFEAQVQYKFHAQLAEIARCIKNQVLYRKNDYKSNSAIRFNEFYLSSKELEDFRTNSGNESNF